MSVYSYSLFNAQCGVDPWREACGAEGTCKHDIGVQWPGWRRSGGDGQDMAPIGQRAALAPTKEAVASRRSLLGFVATWTLHLHRNCRETLPWPSETRICDFQVNCFDLLLLFSTKIVGLSIHIPPSHFIRWTKTHLCTSFRNHVGSALGDTPVLLHAAKAKATNIRMYFMYAPNSFQYGAAVPRRGSVRVPGLLP